MKHRILAVFLALALLLTSCAFAEGNGTEGYLTDEPVTLTVMKMANGLEKVSSANELGNVKYFCETTNVYLDFTLITDGEQLNLAINTNSMPDIFLACAWGPSDWDSLGMKGSIMPLNDLIDEYCPYIQSLFERMPQAKSDVTALDGNIYTLPYIVDTGNSMAYNDMLIYKPWLDKVGLDVPKTVDELTEVLKAFRDNDMDGDGDTGNEIPFEHRNLDIMESSMLPWYGEIRSSALNGYFSISEDYQLQKLFCTDGYRAFIEYVTMLYQEKLLDQEVFTKSEEQKTSNLFDNEIGCLNYWFTNPTEGDLDNWIWMEPLTSEYQEKPMARGTDKITGGGWALSATCSDPVLAMKVADLIFRPWNDTWFGICGLWGNNGVEGLDYEIVDGHIVNTYLDEVPDTGEYSAWTWYLGYRGLGGISLGLLEINGIILEKDETENDRWSMRRRAILRSDNAMADPQRVLSSATRFDQDENDRLSILLTDIAAIKNEQIARFITGRDELNDATWESFLANLDSVGYEEAFEMAKTAFERQK